MQRVSFRRLRVSPEGTIRASNIQTAALIERSSNVNIEVCIDTAGDS